MSQPTIVRELAKMIDHSLLHPTLTDQELKEGCLLAKQYDTASVCIKPYAVKDATKWLAGSDVLVGTVIGFPHGNSRISVKVAETVQACEDGAVEIDMVVNAGKVLGGDWDYVEREIDRVCRATHMHGAILKVIFENDFLTSDEDKIRLCRICSELKVDFVKTSTGYGMVKDADGKYSYQGATEHDLILMRKHSDPKVQIKAAGGVRTLDQMLKVKELGATRLGASATASLINAAIDRFGGEKPESREGTEKEGY